MKFSLKKKLMTEFWASMGPWTSHIVESPGAVVTPLIIGYIHVILVHFL